MKKCASFLPLIIIGLILIAFTAINHLFSSKEQPSNSSLTQAEREAIRNGWERDNLNLPRPFGTIGYQLKNTFIGDTLGIHFAVTGDSSIDEFYEQNIESLKDCVAYMFFMMNSQSNLGEQFALYISEKRLHLKAYIQTPSGRIHTIHYAPDEPLEIITKDNLAPAEAMAKMLVFQIELLKSQISESSIIHSSATNALLICPGSDDYLADIETNSSTIKFIYIVTDEENAIAAFKPVKNNYQFQLNFANLLAENADSRELMTTMAICKMNYAIEYIKNDMSDSVTIELPYQVLQSILPSRFSNFKD